MLQSCTSISKQFQRLQLQVIRGRSSLTLTQLEIKQLSLQVSFSEKEQLVRSILKQKPFCKRSINDVYILMQCVTIYSFFQKIFSTKGEKALQEFCRNLHYCQLKRAEYLYKKGDIADKLFVLMNGTVSVHLAYKSKVATQNGEVKQHHNIKEATKYEKGEMFGEFSFKQSIARRAVSIFSEVDCELFQIKKKNYDLIQKFMMISSMRQKQMFFQNIDPFCKINKANLEAVLYLASIKKVYIGNILFSEGNYLDQIYIVKEGQFKLQSFIKKTQSDFDPLGNFKIKLNNNSRKFQTSIVGTKSLVGQIDTLMNIPTKESCTCITEQASVFVIKKKDIMDHVQDTSVFQDYLNSRSRIRNNRLKTLNDIFNFNSSVTSIFPYKKCGKTKISHFSSFELDDKRNNKLKGCKNILTQNSVDLKRRKTQYCINTSVDEKSQCYTATTKDFIKINKMIIQKRKYLKKKNQGKQQLFKFKDEIPIFIQVKMGVIGKRFAFQSSRDQLNKTQTNFEFVKDKNPMTKHCRKDDIKPSRRQVSKSMYNNIIEKTSSCSLN